MWQYNQTVYSDELYHYGVKGMKWGVRKRATNVGKKMVSAGRKFDRYLEKRAEKEYYRTNTTDKRVAAKEREAKAADKRWKDSNSAYKQAKQTYKKSDSSNKKQNKLAMKSARKERRRAFIDSYLADSRLQTEYEKTNERYSKGVGLSKQLADQLILSENTRKAMNECINKNRNVPVDTYRKSAYGAEAITTGARLAENAIKSMSENKKKKQQQQAEQKEAQEWEAREKDFFKRS